ncbi:ExeA family protein [Calditrichota bacterium]
MYLEYYGLKEKPFSLSADPKYIYYTENHKEALAQMIYASTQNIGFMVLTGEIGTGKSILINALISQVPKTYHFAKIYHSALSPVGLIQNICKEFKIDILNKSKSELIFDLQDFLKWNYHSGGKSIILLDEAQNLKTETLEEVRLLSNFEVDNKKILQIYFIGHPELKNILLQKKLNQLRERISLHYNLKQLDRIETADYISHRLEIAGKSNGKKLFRDDAIDQIFALTEGIPRRINILCDNSLLMGYTNLYDYIDGGTIDRVHYYNQIGKSFSKKPSDTIASESEITIVSNVSKKIPLEKKSIKKKEKSLQTSSFKNLRNTIKKKEIDYSDVNNLNRQYMKNKFTLVPCASKVRNIIISIFYALAGGIAAIMIALGIYAVIMFF